MFGIRCPKSLTHVDETDVRTFFDYENLPSYLQSQESFCGHYSQSSNVLFVDQFFSIEYNYVSIKQEFVFRIYVQ